MCNACNTLLTFFLFFVLILLLYRVGISFRKCKTSKSPRATLTVTAAMTNPFSN